MTRTGAALIMATRGQNSAPGSEIGQGAVSVVVDLAVLRVREFQPCPRVVNAQACALDEAVFVSDLNDLRQAET